MVTISSITSLLRTYSLPLILFVGAMLYQLFVLPNAFPPSHYDVMGLKRHCPVEEVEEAYRELSSKWTSGTEVPVSVELINIQYAYELLTNPIWKRNYDIFGIEEQHGIVEDAKRQYMGKKYSEIRLPLLEPVPSDSGDLSFNSITSKDFPLMFETDQPPLVLVYSSGSNCCTEFAGIWRRTVALLDGVANTGTVEVGEVQLAVHLTERKPTGLPFFRNGLPSIVAFPPGCKSFNCLLRFDGELTVDAITDWFATDVLGLPRILYYSKESLIHTFMAKMKPHKVKVIFVSKTGERATPFIRLTSKNYWSHASFAFVLWREEESSFWWNVFEVESAPAVVFLKDPGAKPVVYHGPINNTWFSNIMEQNKNQELHQLRGVSSLELGCDARGYSRAGVDTVSWYCVILAGRLSKELNEMRGTMCRVQEILSNDDEIDAAKDLPSQAAAGALKQKRLTFAWLNGEVQKAYCLFYLQSETSYETCGPRRDIADVPRLFIVRYKRNTTEENKEIKKMPKSIWNTMIDEDVDPASQLVAKYNGSNEVPEIIQWISNIIRDGDSRDLPFYRTKTPELLPEDEGPFVSRGTQSIMSRRGTKQMLYNFIRGCSDHLRDPRIGPFLLLGALMSFGTIWLRRSQLNQPSRSTNTSESTSKEATRARRRERERLVPDSDRRTSIADTEPANAYEMKFSDSDSE